MCNGGRGADGVRMSDGVEGRGYWANAEQMRRVRWRGTRWSIVTTGDVGVFNGPWLIQCSVKMQRKAE